MEEQVANTGFVDEKNGNDATGKLDFPAFPFKTFQAVYQSIKNLGICSVRPSYTISFASGIYTMVPDRYENISLEVTNENESIQPHIIIPDGLQEWNGVIVNELILCIDASVSNFREPIHIIGASSIESSVDIIVDTFLTQTPTHFLVNNISNGNQLHEYIQYRKKTLIERKNKFHDNQ